MKQYTSQSGTIARARLRGKKKQGHRRWQPRPALPQPLPSAAQPEEYPMGDDAMDGEVPSKRRRLLIPGRVLCRSTD